MCGIAGVLDPEGPGPLEEMTRLLTHRGPDASGLYTDTGVGLGHRRLRILDLSDKGRQPMSDDAGSVWVSFNGEIYNYRELRAELEQQRPFRSSSDTEVIVHGYKAWGSEVFRRLNGMFAIALWDASTRTLLLARDRLGKKPLFYFWDGRRVVFASELKSVMAHPAVSRKVDPQSLAQYFAFGYVPTPRSILRDVFKVPQGTVLAFRDGARSGQSFWELPVVETPVPEDEACDRLEALLTDAVRTRLFSDVPLGFFLSGGVDSSLIVALAKRLGADVRTFTVGFQARDFDEAPFAREVAEKLGTRHTETLAAEGELPGLLDEAPRYFDEPFADSSLLPTLVLSRLTREHVVVALSGDGGDELFCGYPKYAQLRRTGPLLGVPRPLRSLLRGFARLVRSDRFRKATEAVASRSLPDLARWLVSIWKPEELASLMPGVPVAWGETAFQQTWDAFDGRDVVTRFMAADVRSYLSDDILQKVDRASMACALEVRCPLLDHRVVEMALGLPLDLKFRGGVQKILLRKLLGRLLPPELWDRPKHGFEVPLRDWYRTHRRAFITRAIGELGEAFPGQLSVDVARETLRQHVEGGRDYSRKLFSLDMLHGWVRRYL